MKYSKEQIRQLIAKKLEWDFDVKPSDASDNQFYKALASVIVDILEEKRQQFYTHSMSNGRKQVYYLSMEFLMGRSLKNSIYNLGLVEPVRAALKDYGVNLENLYEQEPDAGLGNGGLGRLAACFLDSLATLDYPATGYSICYEFGIFKQKIVDGWQTELPDNWLPGGEVWLKPAPDSAVDVNFGGEVEEFWDSGYHHVNHKNYTTVRAVPYNMYVSGYGSQGVSLLRLWKAESPAFDIDSFQQGRLRQRAGTELHRRGDLQNPVSQRQPHRRAKSCGCVSSILCAPLRWGILSSGICPHTGRWRTCMKRSPSTSTTPIPPWRSRS